MFHKIDAFEHLNRCPRRRCYLSLFCRQAIAHTAELCRRRQTEKENCADSDVAHDARALTTVPPDASDWTGRRCTEANASQSQRWRDSTTQMLVTALKPLWYHLALSHMCWKDQGGSDLPTRPVQHSNFLCMIQTVSDRISMRLFRRRHDACRTPRWQD